MHTTVYLTRMCIGHELQGLLHTSLCVVVLNDDCLVQEEQTACCQYVHDSPDSHTTLSGKNRSR